MRHQALLKRKHLLTLECNLTSLLRIGRENLSRVEQEAVYRLSYELEQLGAAAAAPAPNTELGSWRLVHAPTKLSMLKRVLKRSSPQTERDPTVQKVTYLSAHLKIARATDGGLFIYQRISGTSPVDPCEACAKPLSINKPWTWPL